MQRIAARQWVQVFRALWSMRAEITPLPQRNAIDSQTRFITAAYHTILRRVPDAAGFAHYQTALTTRQQSRLSFIHELLASIEYRQSSNATRTAQDAIVDARRLLIKYILPPGDVVVDLGGGATETPEGALRFWGYPHHPQQLIIVDLPPTTRLDGWWSSDEVPTVKTADGITVSYQYGSMTNLRFLADNSVDVVVSGESIEHITLDDADQVCQEVYRVLRPGGFFCLDTPNANLTRLLSPTQFIHPEHQHEYTPTELTRKLGHWGFTIVRRIGLCPMPRSVQQQQFDYGELACCASLSEDIEQSFLFYLQAIKP